MSLRERIDPSWVAVDLDVGDQASLFRWITGRMAETGFLSNPSRAYAKLLERERIVSTAIFPGVAVPHARCEDCDAIGLSVVRLAQGIDFAARDGLPVNLVFALLGPPESTAEHVRVLGHVARLIRDPGALRVLKEAPTPDDLLAALS